MCRAAKAFLVSCIETGNGDDQPAPKSNLPRNPANAESARLMIRIWDGGEGTVTEHFKINGHPYSITSGRANHDLVFKNIEVNIEHLKAGSNSLTLLSDTEHHGIEILLPGPCLLLRYGKSVQLPFD